MRAEIVEKVNLITPTKGAPEEDYTMEEPEPSPTPKAKLYRALRNARHSAANGVLQKKEEEEAKKEPAVVYISDSDDEEVRA